MGLAHACGFGLVNRLERHGALALCSEHAKSLVCGDSSSQHSRDFGNYLSSRFQKTKDELVCLSTAYKKTASRRFFVKLFTPEQMR